MVANDVSNVTLSLETVAGSTIESYSVLCDAVQLSLKSNLVAKPLLNSLTLTEVQKQTIENPQYNLRGVILTEQSGSLTYAKLLEFFKKTNPDSSGYVLRLSLNYGSSTNTFLPDFSGATDGIKVTISDVSFRINQSKLRYTEGMTLKDQRALTGDITLLESN